jgi:CRP-like cAMP-binding protein
METPENLAERLGNVSHFMKLPLADRLSITLAGKIRRFPPDTDIFSEQEPCAGMFVLFKGHVHISTLSPQGKKNIIADIDPVIMFNEIALLDGGTNPYTATTTQNCITWQFSREAYLKLLQRYAQDKFTQVSLGLLDIMASRYRQLLDSYADLSFMTVPIRVAKLIFELSEEGETPINRNQNSLIEMAAHVASVPEAISRALNFLKCQGIIATTRTTITVLKPEELARMAKIGSNDIFTYGHKE